MELTRDQRHIIRAMVEQVYDMRYRMRLQLDQWIEIDVPDIPELEFVHEIAPTMAAFRHVNLRRRPVHEH